MGSNKTIPRNECAFFVYMIMAAVYTGHLVLLRQWTLRWVGHVDITAPVLQQ